MISSLTATRTVALLAIAAGAKGRAPTKAAVAARLAPFVAGCAGDESAACVASRLVDELAGLGLVEAAPALDGARGKALRWILTAAGRSALEAAAGDVSGYRTWPKLRDAVAVPLAARAAAEAAPAAVAAAVPAPESLESFARRVREAARRTSAGRYGSRRVFLSHVLQTLGERDTVAGRWPQRARLLEANRKGLLSLARADLAPDLDRNDVARSLVRGPIGDTYHFVALEEAT